MIKANELRIGNLVEKDGFWYETDFITIQMAHNYNAIPLTPEILEKCGFVTINAEDFKYNGKGMAIGLAPCNLEESEFYLYDYKLRNKGKVRIKYVHQLQNLYFALTGEELQVNL